MNERYPAMLQLVAVKMHSLYLYLIGFSHALLGCRLQGLVINLLITGGLKADQVGLLCPPDPFCPCFYMVLWDYFKTKNEIRPLAIN